jgi:predicted P-loop ATPase
LAALVEQPDWYSDTPIDLRHKQDAFQVLQGKWIYEIGELHSFRGQDATRIKNFLSASSDNYRASYGKRNRTYPRHCVFAGTTNETQYLTDRSGNRRFWPVTCGKVDVEGVRRDRGLLWAEALARFESNEPWHTTDAALAALVMEQQEARLLPEDPWTDLVAKWLVYPTVPVDGAVNERSLVDVAAGFSTNDVLLGAIGVRRDALDRARATRVGLILQALGFDSRQVRVHGTVERVRRYFRRA